MSRADAEWLSRVEGSGRQDSIVVRQTDRTEEDMLQSSLSLLRHRLSLCPLPHRFQLPCQFFHQWTLPGRRPEDSLPSCPSS